ncbi:ANTAR domain-containing protein (plasmid) [Rhodococcus opacus]
MRLLTSAASAAISNARRWSEAQEHVRQLQQALISRAEIDQAKGVLMGLHHLTADQAFDRLVERSQHSNTKLRDVARAVIAAHTHRRR